MTRFGVQWPLEVPNPETHARSIANLGVKEVRLQFSWANIERSQGNRDWSFYDHLIRDVIRPAGLGVLPTIYQSPAWHRSTVQAAPDPWTLAGFVVEAIRHFDFRNGVEIWNEPNWRVSASQPLDWDGSFEQYADCYRISRQAVRAAGLPSGPVLIGGLAYPTGWPDKVSGTAMDFLGWVWDRLGPIDGVGFHPYSFGPDPLTETMDKLKAMARFLTNKGAGAPIDVTEINVEVPPRTEKQRSGYLRQLAEKVKPWPRIRRLDVFAFYSPPATGMGGWSIANADGSWKGGASGYHTGIVS